MATIVASDSASCVTRKSGPRPLSSRPPIVTPTPTETLENSNAAVPAARLVIQKRWPSVAAARSTGAASAPRAGETRGVPGRSLSPLPAADDLAAAVAIAGSDDHDVAPGATEQQVATRGAVQPGG